MRLTGRALKAFQQLPEASQRDYKEAKKVVKKTFEPESRQEYYIAELQTRGWNKGEDCIGFIREKAKVNRGEGIIQPQPGCS